MEVGVCNGVTVVGAFDGNLCGCEMAQWPESTLARELDQEEGVHEVDIHTSR